MTAVYLLCDCVLLTDQFNTRVCDPHCEDCLGTGEVELMYEEEEHELSSV